MELIESYLRGTLVDFSFYIANKKREIFEVRTESLRIKHYPVFLRAYEFEVHMQDWVYDEINQSAYGWMERNPLIIVKNGMGEEAGFEVKSIKMEEEKGYKILKGLCQEIEDDGIDSRIPESPAAAARIEFVSTVSKQNDW